MTNKPVTAMSVKMIAKILSYEQGQIKGELDSIYFKEPCAFNDVSGMIEIMETAFDALGFPDKALLPRTFGKAKERMRRHETDIEQLMQERFSSTASGDKDKSSNEPMRIFEIFVNFRLNAEWQGRLHRPDTDETKEFRSIVELVRLIN